MARTIAVCNQKGGVGKTTTAINIAASIAENGDSVLLVDLDPRADLSAYLGIYLEPAQPNVYQALFDEDVALRDVIVETAWPNLHVAPATIDLSGAEMLLMQSEGSARHDVVKSMLGALAGEYDYIILDNPPGLQLLSVAALASADEVIVPQQCSFLALHGLRQLSTTIEGIKAQINPNLHISSIIMTMQDRRTLHNQQVIDMVKEGFGDLVLDIVIPTSIRIQEAAAAGQPIIAYDPHGAAAKAYRQVAREVLKRG